MSPTNRLAQATSPYLLQHAHNPVDWYPWGEEAIERARREDKPIFLSIGYSACHWCHVMERESFEDPETARLMNGHFVNIKVDREERPDLDEIYMQAVQLFTGGHGGWPMSVFLTPALVPYYAGTYFPPAARHGMASFRNVLNFVADAYRNRKPEVTETTQQVLAALHQMGEVPTGAAVPGTDVLDAAFRTLGQRFDAEQGGFGGAPKFPHSMDVSFLLRYGRRTGSAEATRMALFTLRKMARGGMYDQVGGGFHRYSTDARWLIPHFEKMLYDNALLARTYLEGYQVTGDAAVRDVVREILAYVAREMTAPDGGFYSAQDADSEGVEGKFFAWTPSEIEAVCGVEEARVVCNYYHVTPGGNFEHGASVLSVPRDPDVVALDLGMKPEALQEILSRARVALLAARERRVRPGRDDKIVAAWNGLMIRAWAQAYQVLGDAEYLERARAAASFVLAESGDGLFRTWKDGRRSGAGFLDDYACMIAALLDLYEASFEPRWLDAAREWNDLVLREFSNADGGFAYTGVRHESLITSARSLLDNATPAGSSVQTANLLRLAMLTADDRLRERAERNLQALAPLLEQYAGAMGEMLGALDLYHGPACEVAVAGQGAATEPLVRAVFAPFFPNKVVAGWPAEGTPADVSLLRDRPLVGGKPAVYVCRHYTCRAPVVTPDETRAAILGSADNR
jgi:uncharacterized protein YyaL (SSP411 family)